MFDSLIQPQITTLRAYQPGMTIEQLARQHSIKETDIIKLASNENPLGPSPNAISAAIQALENTNRYPDQHTLTEAIAEFYTVSSDSIIIGNGSNDILDLIARVFLGPGVEAVSSQYGFQIYALLTTLAGAKNVITPALNYGHNLDAMLNLIVSNTRVVWIANPNNPTGTFCSYEKIGEFLRQVPESTIVVLDEAYYEYLDDSEKIDSLKFLETFPNLIIVRTFSKIYGLAGFRVGYGIAHPELIALLHRTRQPFNVTMPSLAAATSALNDQDYVKKSKFINKDGITYLEQELSELGIDYIKSYTNFATIIHDDASRIHQALLKEGIIVRPLTGDGLENCLRCTVGLPNENKKLIDNLRTIIEEI